MLNRNLIVIVTFGLFSSMAFADVIQPKHLDLEYRCKFEESEDMKLKTGHKDKDCIECWVEGTLREEAASKRDERISIKCTNGFELRTDDVAFSLEDNTLWINAEREHEGEKIATIRVKHFFPLVKSPEHDFRRHADLMFSRHEGDADRLEGSCKFEERK